MGKRNWLTSILSPQAWAMLGAGRLGALGGVEGLENGRQWSPLTLPPPARTPRGTSSQLALQLWRENPLPAHCSP